MLQAGEYRGKIIDANMGENEGGNAYAMIKCKPEGSPETANWLGSFSETVISRGPNEGRTVASCTIDTLAKLGWDGNFESLATIINRDVIFGVKHVPDKKKPGQTWVEVNYIKLPGSGKPVNAATAKGLAAKFKGEALQAIKNAKVPPAQTKPAATEDFGPTEYDEANDPF